MLATGNPARRPEAREIQHRQPEHTDKRPLRPPLPPIEDPHAEPNTEGCERHAQGWKHDAHAGILTGVEWGREGRIESRHTVKSRSLTDIAAPVVSHQISMHIAGSRAYNLQVQVNVNYGNFFL
jgi:hypothetical protein